ncbi:MAG: tRNA 2-thiouridine(34) synthase MnmA [Clostridia bacterium]|nr:tRNA 2-thiouridine(34) synthase MnmA [Clostridia bacterium]
MKTVVVGMSGGVDSSVAALLLKRAGYDVIGLFMHNWEEEDGGACTAAEDWADVRAVCGKIGIPHYSVNFSKEYGERVFAHFLHEYEAGRTPNPDVLCNREIKFGVFRDYALKLGAAVATGHYCDIGEMNGEPVLLKALDQNKDQTYFLCDTKTEQLRDVMFPLGKLAKDEVRKIATENGLATSGKKDSTGICFIGERKFRAFLSEYLPAKEGKIVDVSGREIGTHYGLMYYTLGQRRGLGIGGVKGEAQERWYVVEKNLKDNVLVVSCGEGEELLSHGLKTEGFNFIGKVDYPEVFRCTAKMRYRQGEQGVTVKMADGNAVIKFDERQRAVTPGQYAVLYDGDRCLGGGVIGEVYAQPFEL